jgi:CheY-like chemotaxis protein
LQQVLWNLLSNAVKFTPAGGAIRIRVSREEQPTVSVADTGVGIAPELLPHVFDRFRQADQTTTRPHGGLGLGLSIVKHLVDLHGGSVSVSSTPGQGACFTVRLPAGDPALAEVPLIMARGPDVSLAGATILIVDDDASTREVVTAALERSGARVFIAASAAEGWTALHACTPHVLISDVAMPVEDGFSFMRRIRNSSPIGDRVIAIALSAFADPRSEASARAAGFSAFLAKPVRSEDLVNAVYRLRNNASKGSDIAQPQTHASTDTVSEN